MYFVVDTHAFLWYLLNSPKLSSEARHCFDLIDNGKATMIIPAIVLLECIDILDKKKVILDFEDIALKITQASNCIISEINWGLILEINRVKGFSDIHDRVIVTVAKTFGAPLISRDKMIKSLYGKTIW